MKALFQYLMHRSPKKYITAVISGIPQDCLVISESEIDYLVTYTQVEQVSSQVDYCI